MSAQRYTVYADRGLNITSCNVGEWVKYKDHYKLKIAYDRLREIVEREEAIKLIVGDDSIEDAFFIVRYTEDHHIGWYASNILTYTQAKAYVEKAMNNPNISNINVFTVQPAKVEVVTKTVVTAIKRG